MRVLSNLPLLAASLVFFFASKAVGAALKLAEREQSLAVLCARYNVNCLRISANVYIPESNDIIRSEAQNDGSRLMLLNGEGASGNAECGSSVALWSVKGANGDKIFDGRDQKGQKNLGISGYFDSDPSKKTTHGVLKTKAVGADLILKCSAGSTLALDGTAAHPKREQLDGNLDRRETLANVCKQRGKMCVRISSNMYIPDPDAPIAGSEPQSDGTLLLLVDDKGGKGDAQCGDSHVTWSFAPGNGNKVFDGRDVNGEQNKRISAYWSSDPGKSTTHGLLITTADADLVMSCK